MVSNSLASWANSSSSSGSSRSLTDPTVTVTTASLPACSPATSFEVNSFDSPAVEADQRLVEALDELTGADLVRQAGGGGLFDVLAVDGGRQVDGHEVTVLHAALDTGEGAEALTQRQELLVDVLVVDLDAGRR